MTAPLTLKNSEWLSRMAEERNALSDRFYAMYSSLTGGITTDPALMCIPVDDHLTHRGDGAFESLKCLNGSLYNVKAHLKRLERSCAGIGLTLPCPTEDLEEIVCETIRAGNRREGCVAGPVRVRGCLLPAERGRQHEHE
jgi:branched-subunit amino acid aminotransferase/4-amino-4-deoxychorismate lyase